MPTITVRHREVYGNVTIYPVCDAAKLFAAIAGTKTLTPPTLRLIAQLGYGIELVAPFAVTA